MNPEKIKSIRLIIEKGKRSLIASEKSIENADYDFATSRAYYVVFILCKLHF